jgi:hypothetical protein
MKKTLVALAVAGVLTACSSTRPDSYQQQAELQRQQQQASAQTAIKQMPKWFMNRPKNSSAVIYGVGYGVSSNMMMAKTIAESEAYRELCIGGNGVVDAQDKLYRSDRDGQGNNIGTTVIRNRCVNLDVTGAETADSQVFVNGNRFSYYVLVALPQGDANSRLQAKRAISQIQSAELQMATELKELDSAKQQ